jgi:hypothetical protein
MNEDALSMQKSWGTIWSSAVRFASLFNTDQVGGPHAIEAGEKKK